MESEEFQKGWQELLVTLNEGSNVEVHEKLQTVLERIKTANSRILSQLNCEKVLMEFITTKGATLGTSRALAVVCCKLGASSSLNIIRASLLAAVDNRGKPEVRMGCVYVLGHMFQTLGLDAGSMMQECSEKFCKMCKSSKTLRFAAVFALSGLLYGMGENSRILHDNILKALKSVLVEKNFQGKVEVARCLGALGETGTAATVEAVLEHLNRLLEDTDPSVFSEATTALGKVMECVTTKYHTKKEQQAKQATEDNETIQWSLVNTVKFACTALKRSSNVNARAGLGYAIARLLFDSPLHVKEDGLGSLVSVIMGLVLGSDEMILQLRAVASHILRHGMGKTMGTIGRRKFFSILAKSLDNSQSNDWVRCVIFEEMAHLVQELGEESADLLEGTNETLQRYACHNFGTVRHASVCCLMAFAGSGPFVTAKLCTQQLELIQQALTAGEASKLTGHSVALAGLLTEGSRSEFGLPREVLDKSWNCASILMSGGSNVVKIQSGWAIYGSLFCFGSSVLTSERLDDVFAFLKSAFVVNDKLASEKAIITYIRRNENILSAIRVLLENALSLVTEQHLLLLTQVLNQIVTTVSTIPKVQPLVASAVHMYRIAMYEVFAYLPASYYQSSAVALLKALSSDVLEGHVSSLVRMDLHSSDFVLESLTYASDTHLFEEQPAPNISVQALRSKRLSDRLFYTTSSHVAVVDKAVSLFPVVFGTQSAKRQSQVIAHLVKCALVVRNNPNNSSPNITLNCLCTITRLFQKLTKLRSSLGSGPVLTNLLNWLKVCAVDSVPLVRRSAVKCLGHVCRCEGAQITVSMMKTALGLVGSSSSLTEKIGGSQIIGAIHKITGAIQVASFQDSVTLALLSSLGNKELDVWLLHSLWLVIEARGPSFAPLSGKTLESIYSNMTGASALLNPSVCILLGRVVNAIVSVLGLDLQPGSRRFNRFNCIISEFKSFPHALVQQEALHFQQMLILFAPRTVDVPSLVLLLRRELRSPYVSLRTAAVICTNQLLQMSPEAVVEQRLEQELFYMLDNATDPELNDQLERLISSLVDALALAAPSRLINLCKEILEAKELRKPKGGATAFSGPTGEEGKLKYADEEDDDDDKEKQQQQQQQEGENVNSGDDQTFLPSIQTKRYCLKCVGRAVQALEGKKEHFDLKLAREAQAKGTGTDFLAFSLRELINMGSRAAASSVNMLRREGVVLIEFLVKSFASSIDPDYETQDGTEEDDGKCLLLKQYESPISSAISASFQDAPPNVVAAACRVAAAFLCSNVRYDTYTMNRLSDIMSGLIKNLLHLEQFAMYSWRASTMVQVALLDAFAQLYRNTGRNAYRVSKFVEPLLSQLLDYWCLFLKDSVAVLLPFVVDSSFPSTFFPTQVPLPSDIKQCFGSARPVILEAASSLVGSELWREKDRLEARNVVIGICFSELNSISEPLKVSSALDSLSHLLRDPSLVIYMFEEGIFSEFVGACKDLVKPGVVCAIRLSCVKLLGLFIESIEKQNLQRETWLNALKESVSILASQVLAQIPSLSNNNGSQVFLPGQLPDEVLDLVAQCLNGLAGIHYNVSVLLDLGPPILRLAVHCLKIGSGVLEKASFNILRGMLVLPSLDNDSAEEEQAKQQWENTMHAALVSLATPSSSPFTPSILQACAVVFSALPFDNPNDSVYRVVAEAFKTALAEKSESSLRVAAMLTFRSLLESSVRQREQKPKLFQQCMLFFGSIGAEVISAIITAGPESLEAEEGLKVLVLAHALAGLISQEAQGEVLDISLPVYVSLLNPDLSHKNHMASLQVILSLAQTLQMPFKTAVTHLQPEKFALLQRSLKQKAENDLREKEAEELRQRQKAKQSAPQKIDFSNWGKK